MVICLKEYTDCSFHTQLFSNYEFFKFSSLNCNTELYVLVAMSTDDIHKVLDIGPR